MRTQAIEPPEHCVEYMRLYGLLDLDLNDPDLAPLFIVSMRGRVDKVAVLIDRIMIACVV
ncbi:hypothetical protein Scep_006335 [Stephania cephalantha]|uniref:Uncharacterized protein n=1 Tax=Stephania cephalantha TaxID=152367 RepID=A0AAP0PJZ6_9MAGN